MRRSQRRRAAAMRTEVQKRGHYHWSPMGCTQVGCGGGGVMGVSSQQLLASPLHPLTAIMNADVDIHKNKLRTFLVDSFSFQHLLHRKIIPSVFRLCGPFDFFFPSDKYFVCVCVCVCVCVYMHTHTLPFRCIKSELT